MQHLNPKMKNEMAEENLKIINNFKAIYSVNNTTYIILSRKPRPNWKGRSAIGRRRYYIINIINLATCFGSLSHSQANSYKKVKVQSVSVLC